MSAAMRSQEIKKDEVKADASAVAQQMEEIPDGEKVSGNSTDFNIFPGGYGWVIVVCCFFVNTVSWGMNSTFGVYLSFFLSENYYPEATTTDFAFIGGLSVAVALFSAPFVNYCSKRFNYKICCWIGAILASAGQILAGFSHRIWQLFLTQGVLFGLGVGVLFVVTQPVLAQWFSKKRALANGLAGSGSGAGGLLFSNTTRLAIQSLSLRWAFVINGIITLAVLVPCIILMKSRAVQVNAKFEPLRLSYLRHPGFVYVWVWGFFSMFAYVTALFSLPTFATQGLGLSQTQGAALQSILCAGQMIGRPFIGLSLDKFGRVNLGSLCTLIAGLSVLLIWMLGRSFGVLIFYALVQGIFGGIFWTAASSIAAEVVGISDLGSALAILWLTLVIPALFSEVIALNLVKYSEKHLNRTGADSYLIAIGFAGACFCAGGLILVGAKAFVLKRAGKPFTLLSVYKS